MILNDTFKKTDFDFDKLLDYGFIKEKDYYTYNKKFFNDQFKLIIKITSEGKISNKIIDLNIDEEYFNIDNQNIIGEYINKLREEYTKILNDIKNHCCNSKLFISKQSNDIADYIYNKYKVRPEFLFENDDNTGVFRNNNSKKWFGIIMYIDYKKISFEEGKVEVINLKTDDLDILKYNGVFKAYHMNKKYWVTISLDNRLDNDFIYHLIDESYNLVSKK